jgi:hypothetical protein
MKSNKLHSPLLTLMLAVCFAIPAAAQLYSNGPINGNTDAWTINFGFAVSDSFTVSGEEGVATGVSFGAWLYPGDVLTSAEVSITSSELGGTTYFDGTVNFSQSGCFTNSYGFNVCTESASFAATLLPGGTVWLNLQNASVPSGDPVYWDENSGPSLASENAYGTIPSESFTILAECSVGSKSPDCGPPPTTPEPGSWLLLASGALALLGGGGWRRYR